MLIDPYKRPVNYLRVSVTDRCDFRCQYCMAENMTFLPKKDLLSLEEIERICKTFINLGTKKIRITGGEPLVRKNDRDREYPETFVNSLTKNGYLACLIPEKYGGSGLNIRAAAVILEEIHRSGGNGAACHAQMYIMGSLLKHGSERLKEKYLYDIAGGKLRLQAFGV